MGITVGSNQVSNINTIELFTLRSIISNHLEQIKNYGNNSGVKVENFLDLCVLIVDPEPEFHCSRPPSNSICWPTMLYIPQKNTDLFPSPTRVCWFQPYTARARSRRLVGGVLIARELSLYPLSRGLWRTAPQWQQATSISSLLTSRRGHPQFCKCQEL